jgi:hypothetical protein
VGSWPGALTISRRMPPPSSRRTGEATSSAAGGPGRLQVHLKVVVTCWHVPMLAIAHLNIVGCYIHCKYPTCIPLLPAGSRSRSKQQFACRQQYAGTCLRRSTSSSAQQPSGSRLHGELTW